MSINNNNQVGQSIAHDSAVSHVTGAALYIDDIPEPAGLLHVAIGQTAIAYGRVKSMDLSAVSASAGVICVVTADDIPGHRDIGPVFPGDPLFVEDEVHFMGQALFAVAANSLTDARRAARKAKVEYEESTPRILIEEALAAEDFVRPSHVMQRGESEKVLNAAKNRIKGESFVGGQEHFYLEGQASMAVPHEFTQQQGYMLVYSSNQNPTEVQKLVAEVLAVPMNRVVADVRRMGGAFGGKETQANPWACVAALIAAKTGRAAKCRLPRGDDMVLTGKRHDFLNRYDVAFSDDGAIEAVDFDLSARCGSSPDLSDAIVDRAMFHCDNAYYLPHVRVAGHRCRTHTVSNTAFRGFGGPQGIMAAEVVIDEIARATGLDTLDVRKRNFYQPDSKQLTQYHQEISHFTVPELVRQLEKTADYWQRREAITKFNSENQVIKRGLALTPVKFGISFTATHLNQAGALLHIYMDGSLHLNHGGTEMGQGLFTKVRQVVADVFGVAADTVGVSATRTDKVPNTSPTAASSGTDLNGMAALDAAHTLRQRLVKFAVENYAVAEEQIKFRNGQVLLGDKTLSFADFVNQVYMSRASLSATGYYRTPEIYYDREKAMGKPFFYFANGAAVTEVMVDTNSGEYSVTAVDIIQDVGDSLNPAIDIGQIEGGYVQGLGWLTTEEVVWHESGKLLSNSPANYKIPAVSDVPEHFNVRLMDNSPNREATIYHSKAVGEPPLMLAISAWCALRDAVSSLSDYKLSPRLDAPATTERVLFAMDEIVNRNKGA
ncbi:MAG: xanthine dehydrogenase large subunit [Parasphingorhabdus sp.]|jgi:xanthine dehydrogenase large subunit